MWVKVTSGVLLQMKSRNRENKDPLITETDETLVPSIHQLLVTTGQRSQGPDSKIFLADQVSIIAEMCCCFRVLNKQNWNVQAPGYRDDRGKPLEPFHTTLRNGDKHCHPLPPE